MYWLIQCLLHSIYSVNWNFITSELSGILILVSTNIDISYLQMHYLEKTSREICSLIFLIFFLGCGSSYCCSPKRKWFFRKDSSIHKPGLCLSLCFTFRYCYELDHISTSFVSLTAQITVEMIWNWDVYCLFLFVCHVFLTNI